MSSGGKADLIKKFQKATKEHEAELGEPAFDKAVKQVAKPKPKNQIFRKTN